MAKADPLTSEQIEMIINELEKTRHADRNVFMFRFMLNVPLRASDIRMIRVKDVYDKRVFKVKQKKTKNEVELFVSEGFKQIIKKYIDENKLKKNDYLFKSQKNEPLSTRQMLRIIQDAADKAEIKVKDEINVSCHSTRKTWAVDALDSWGSDQLYTVSEMLGHKSLDSTRNYLFRTTSKYLELVDNKTSY